MTEVCAGHPEKIGIFRWGEKWWCGTCYRALSRANKRRLGR